MMFYWCSEPQRREKICNFMSLSSCPWRLGGHVERRGSEYKNNIFIKTCHKKFIYYQYQTFIIFYKLDVLNQL